jgi:hypothetical protein
MSSPARARRDLASRLPSALRPRTEERRGTGRLRLIETTLLVIAAVLLATATINDVARQVGVEHRLSTDLATWRARTGHDYRNLSVDQQLLGQQTEHEVVCGNTRPGPPKSSAQLCLEIWGPVRSGRRQVHGGWYIPARSEDERQLRSRCFGAAVVEALCPR